MDREEETEREEDDSLHTFPQFHFGLNVLLITLLLFHYSGKLGQPDKTDKLIKTRNSWEFCEHIEFSSLIGKNCRRNLLDGQDGK